MKHWTRTHPAQPVADGWLCTTCGANTIFDPADSQAIGDAVYAYNTHECGVARDIDPATTLTGEWDNLDLLEGVEALLQWDRPRASKLWAVASPPEYTLEVTIK